MKSYVPIDIKNLEPLKSIYESEAIELDTFMSNLQVVINNMFVITATEIGLDKWEEFLGIIKDPAKSETNRREIISGKLRGAGTTSLYLVQNVADSYENGIVTITEDYANYTVTINFVSEIGIPPNFEDFNKAIVSIMPAHLQIIYNFTYNTHGDIYGRLNSLLATKTYEELRSSILP
jgi:hypothetical protein